MSSTSAKRRRKNLFNQYPHCCWCGKKLSEYPEYENARKLYPVGDSRRKMPDDYATLDHLNSQFKGKRPYEHYSCVLACPPCNVRRSNEELKRYKWRTRWKSGAFPRGLRWFGLLLKRWRKMKKHYG